MSGIKEAFLKLVSSLKFWTVILWLGSAIAAKYGFNVDEDVYWTIVAAFGALVTGQALKGFGAVAAQVKAASDKDAREAYLPQTLPAGTGGWGGAEVTLSSSVHHAGTVTNEHPVGATLVSNDEGLTIASTAEGVSIPMPDGTTRTLSNAMLLSAGYVKQAPEVNPQAGRATIGAMLMCVLLAMWPIGLALLTSCGSMKNGAKNAAGALVDCLKPASQAHVKEYLPVFDVLLARSVGLDGKIDREAVKATTKNILAETGGCVLATAFAKLLSTPQPKNDEAPLSEAQDIDRAELLKEFNAIRAEHLGGKTFKTSEGTL